jgi:hypothetical protein
MTLAQKVVMERVVAILKATLEEDLQEVADIAIGLGRDLAAAEQNRRELRPELN